MIEPVELSRLKDLSLCLNGILIDLCRWVSPGMVYGDIHKMAGIFLERRRPDAVMYSFDLNPNKVVCHNSLPETVIGEGDIFTLDIVLKEKGLFADQAWSATCGEASSSRKELLQKAWDVSRAALLSVTPYGDSFSMKKAVHNQLLHTDFAILEEACGHGLGPEVHMKPDISYSLFNKDDVLWEPGMVFTIEPVVAAGGSQLLYSDEKIWVTDTNSDTAYFEHMVYVGDDLCECLNLPEIKLPGSIDIFNQIL